VLSEVLRVARSAIADRTPHWNKIRVAEKKRNAIIIETITIIIVFFRNK
jgi:hypothetical protein